MILYEYPFNEKVRSFLRLEYLFKRLETFHKIPEEEYERVLMSVLFEIMEVCDRGEIRNIVLQEIDKQVTTLNKYRHYDGVDQSVIDSTIHNLNEAYKALHQASKIGQSARDSEWLHKLKGRYFIPGGASSIEFPIYHAWLNGPQEARRQVIDRWLASFMPLADAIQAILQLIRMSGQKEAVKTNEKGIYNKDLGGRSYQLIRVWLPGQTCIYPEITANKHISYIRLLKLNSNLEIQALDKVTSLDVSFCNF